MTFNRYIKVLTKRIWVILAVTLISLGIGIYYSFKILTPMYETSTTLYVINKSVADAQIQSQLQTSSMLVKDYRELIQSDAVLSEVIRRINVDMSVDLLKTRISVSQKNETRLLDVRVISTDPVIAQMLADQLGIVFREKAIELMNADNVSIIDTPKLPSKPFSPSHSRDLLLSFLIGLVLSVTTVIFVEFIDDKIKTEEDIESRLLQVLLGIIPNSKKKKEDPAFVLTENHHLAQLDFEINEAYNVVRSNILFCGFKNSRKVITITSGSAQEGKSTVSLNTAISMARSGSRVLLVDADLRKPLFVKNVQSEELDGLSTYMARYGSSVEEAISFESIVRKSGVENLFFVTSGPIPPNPSELLMSKGFDNFIEKAREYFDVVIFDTAPLIAFIDSAILAEKTDMVIVVATAKKTTFRQLRKVLDQLSMAKANIIGVILNRVDLGKHSMKKYSKYDYNSYQSVADICTDKPDTKKTISENTAKERLDLLKRFNTDVVVYLDK